MPVAWIILSMRKAAGPSISGCLERVETDAQRAVVRRERIKVALMSVAGLSRDAIEAKILAAAKAKWQAIEAAETEGAAAIDGGRVTGALNEWELGR